MSCSLCNGLHNIVTQGAYWTLALNRNQNLLGKCLLVLNRHAESVAELTAEEWAQLHQDVREVTRALDTLFAPDLYNYAFLMNLDAHVHLHVVPRYRTSREWQGRSFDDPHFGSLFGTEQYLPDAGFLSLLTAALRVHLPGPGG